MAALDKYSVTLVAQIHNVSVANVFYVNVVDDSGAADTPASISTQFQGFIVTLMRTHQVNTLVYECLLIRKVSPVTEPAIVFTFADTGAQPPEALPTNVTMCINTVSADGRPRFRGRWFIAGLPEADVLNGRWKDIVVIDWFSFLDQITKTFGPAGEIYRLQHFSPFINQFDDIDRGTISPQPRKLRSRTPGICSIS